MELFEWAQKKYSLCLRTEMAKYFELLFVLNKGWRWHKIPSGFRCYPSFPCSSSPFQLAQSKQICRQPWRELIHTTGGVTALIWICKVEWEFIITKILLEMFVKFNYNFRQHLNRTLLKACVQMNRSRPSQTLSIPPQCGNATGEFLTLL